MIHAGAIRLAAALAALVAAPPVRGFTAADTHTPLTATSALPGSIALRGRIVAGSPALVRAALDRAGQAHPVVLIDSPGGAIDPALAIGRLVRARGLEVAVARAVDGRPTDDAQCASACVLVLAGGVSRSVGPRAAVGVHRLVDWTTYSRTWDVYRILRRAVGGRTVVVGRELLSRRILSSREVLTEVLTEVPMRRSGPTSTRWASRPGSSPSCRRPLRRGCTG